MKVHRPRHNVLMYSDLCDIVHRAEPREDQPGSFVHSGEDYPTVETMVPCDQDVLSDDPVAVAIRNDGRQARVRYGFPSDHRLGPGDVILERDDSGRLTGRGCVVELYRRVGRFRLRKYEAICSAWQARRMS